MLTVDKLHKIATEAVENDEWICLVSGDVFTIYKLTSEEEVNELLENMSDYQQDDSSYVIDDNDDTIYTEADHAKDWNFFKNTMGI